MAKSDRYPLRNQWSKRARRYFNLFEQWRDWWTPTAPLRMLSAVAAMVAYTAIGIYTIITLWSMAGVDNADHEGFAVKMGLLIFIVLIVAMWLRERWWRAVDEKRLKRVNERVGGNAKSVDEARTQALERLFCRPPTAFASVAKELSERIELEHRSKRRSTLSITRWLRYFADPDGKQRVIALTIALLATLGAITIRFVPVEGALDPIVEHGWRLARRCLALSFVLWALLILVQEAGSFVWSIATWLETKADGYGVLRYAICDLLMLHKPESELPDWDSDRQAVVQPVPEQDAPAATDSPADLDSEPAGAIGVASCIAASAADERARQPMPQRGEAAISAVRQ